MSNRTQRCQRGKHPQDKTISKWLAKQKRVNNGWCGNLNWQGAFWALRQPVQKMPRALTRMRTRCSTRQWGLPTTPTIQSGRTDAWVQTHMRGVAFLHRTVYQFMWLSCRDPPPCSKGYSKSRLFPWWWCWWRWSASNVIRTRNMHACVFYTINAGSMGFVR